MTRINVIDPKFLSNDHLGAEYYELPRVFTAVRKNIDKGKKPTDFKISNKYILGTGHVTFFYNKLDWLYARIYSIIAEKDRRGMTSNFNRLVFVDPIWSSNYMPTLDDVNLNISRLLERDREFYEPIVPTIIKEFESKK